ncbi:hypothetical protein, partial [Fischerella thermalis]|uniref:hypothetical protein n=1 Tax=Fischerella thermalis TaxID=372787 RepID=UPI001CA5BD01
STFIPAKTPPRINRFATQTLHGRKQRSRGAEGQREGRKDLYKSLLCSPVPLPTFTQQFWVGELLIPIHNALRVLCEFS